MFYRIMLSFYGLIFAVAAAATQANAVSLGKIDIASHLGEPFFAEVPLTLDKGEEIESMYVELASPSDYRILEVYRDQALNDVRADVLSGTRGTRVQLTSHAALDSPFFNLVLKVRYGRATHFKKYPVFLDLPKAIQPVAKAEPLPVITQEEAAASGPVAMVAPEAEVSFEETQVPSSSVSSFKPFDGWARTAHYGPMVYGDTVSTVADRLRIDSRYTRNQVMVAIFEKNRSKFDQDNINLIKAGTHLDVPSAAEVERIRPDQAREIMLDHNRRWRELVKQPRYAAVAEAQKNRYSKRVRTGKSASGVASSPVSGEEGEGFDDIEMSEEPSVEPIEGMGQSGATGAMDDGKSAAEITALNDSLDRLEKENEELKAKLAETEAKVSELASAPPKEDVQAAAEARVKKLELQLARLQSELDNARQGTTASEGPDWLMLIGGGLVLLLLGTGAGYLMRRERAHPALAGGAPIPASYDEPMPMEPEAPEIEVEEIDVEPVEEFSPLSEDQTETEEFDSAFTDSIPDLTDEETGEMEAFKEDMEEEPDPNVDYLSEADVYMRYGMEDEAEKQVQMALKLRENNKDAHVKLVQIRKARGDEPGAEEAISTARMTLAGDSLSTFESTIASLSAGEGGAEDVNLEDTVPPGTIDISEDAEAAQGLEEADVLDDLGNIEFEQEEVPVPPSVETAGETEEAVTMELGDLEFPSADETIRDEVTHEADALPELGGDEEPEIGALPELVGDEEAESEVETVGEGEATVAYEPESDGGLDFDLSGLELPSEEEETSETEFPLLEEADESPVAEAAPAAETVESMDDDSLDLSGLDLSGESAPATLEETELQTADLDKTLVMDWSKDTVTSGDHEIGGESGAGELDISFDLDATGGDDLSEEIANIEEPTTELAEEATEEKSEEPAEIEEPEEHLSSVEFDLEDLDVDLDAPVSSDDVDDFSSTIQTSTAEIEASAPSEGEEKPSAEAADSSGISFDLDSLDEPKAEQPVVEPKKEAPKPKKSRASQVEEMDHEATVRINIDSISLDDFMGAEEGDFDATMELNTLMGELEKDKDSDDEDKKS